MRPAAMATRQFARVVGIEVKVRQQRLAGELDEVVRQAPLGRSVELVERDPEDVGDALEQRSADIALVAFDQVEVGRRDPRLGREPGLRHADRPAALAQRGADQGAGHGLTGRRRDARAGGRSASASAAAVGALQGQESTRLLSLRTILYKRRQASQFLVEVLTGAADACRQFWICRARGCEPKRPLGTSWDTTRSKEE